MNVGFFSEMANVEGSAFHMVRQLRWMIANGHKPVMFSSGGTLEPLLAEMGVPHVRIASVRQGAQLTPEQLCADGAALERAVAAYDLEALVTAPSWPYPLAEAAVGSRVPIFLQILSPVYMTPATPASVEAIRKAAAEGRVLANVYEDALPHAQGFGFDIERVRLCNLPIDDASARPLRARDEVRRELGVGPEELVVFSACRLDADRFPFLQPLAQGIEQLRNAGHRVRLFVAGDGSHAQALRSAQLPGTTYLGVRRDMADLYAAADIYCGEGSTVMEAARAGLPVVMSCALTQPSRAEFAYAIFGLHIVDTFYWTSNTVTPSTPFAEALLPLVEDPELRARLGHEAQRVVMTYWSVDRYMNWLLAVLRGENPPNDAIHHAQASIVVNADGDDVERTAQLLASAAAPERYGVEAPREIPWRRLLAMPTKDAQALTLASRRLRDKVRATYRFNGFELSGTPASGDEELFDASRNLEPPPTALGAWNLGVEPERVTIVVCDREDVEAAISLAKSLDADRAVVCWLPRASETERGVAEAIARNEDSLRDRAQVASLLGPIPWSFVGQVFRGAAAYRDSGRQEFERYRSLAQREGLSVSLLPALAETE